MKDICGVYGIRNVKDNKIYIGSSYQIAERFHEHEYDLNKNKHPNIHLQRAWNKDGKESFVFEILSVCQDEKSLIPEEQKLANFYGLPNPEKGYNIRKVVECNRGLQHSDETKKKLSQISKKMWKNTKTRKKLVANARSVAKKHRKKVICTTTGKVYKSIHEAARKNGISVQNISGSAKYFCKVHGKSYRFLDSSGKPVERTVPLDTRSAPKPVVCNETGIFFSSGKEAGRKMGIRGDAVSRQARGDAKQTHGYTFRYATQEEISSSCVSPST